MSGRPTRLWMRFAGAGKAAIQKWSSAPFNEADAEYIRTDDLATLRTRLAEALAENERLQLLLDQTKGHLDGVHSLLSRRYAENERLRHGLERAELDLRGVSGFVYTGPTDDHMRKAAALIEAVVDRTRAALAQTTESACPDCGGSGKIYSEYFEAQMPCPACRAEQSAETEGGSP